MERIGDHTTNIAENIYFLCMARLSPKNVEEGSTSTTNYNLTRERRQCLLPPDC
jgi:phosphate uptake regulator